ncbi:hypothetical protein Tco_1497081, partial [Tanacetum coccineum]
DSTVYTEVFSPFEDLSHIGSPGVIVHKYDGLPMILEDPYAYVEAAMQELPLPDFVPEPIYPEFIPPEDDVLSAEEQPLSAAISPTTDSSDKEEDDKDPDEVPADYPTDRDDDDEEEESSRDDSDDEEEDEGEDEEEEHLASVDSVDKLLAISTLPPSPLTSYSSPLPQIPSPPLPVSLPLPISPLLLPASPTHSLGYRAIMIWLRAESPSTSHPLPLPSPIVLRRTRASMAMMRNATPSTYCLAPRSETPPSGTPPLLPISLPTSSPSLLLPSTDYNTPCFRTMYDVNNYLFLVLYAFVFNGNR